jgi:hypothetical protein
MGRGGIVKKLSLFVLALSATVCGAARAENWHAEMKPGPNTKSMCPDPPALLEFTVEGSVIRMKTGSGENHAGTVAPDGAVDLRFTSTSTGAGSVIVTGNARSRDLQMTVPRGAPGCVWTLKPLDAVEARQVVSWNATIQQTGGNVQRCLSGHRDRVQTRGPGLAVYAAPSPNTPIIMLRLAPDGSADLDTATYYGSDKTARVKVAPGSGPRLVQFVTLSWVCAYNVVPD